MSYLYWLIAEEATVAITIGSGSSYIKTALLSGWKPVGILPSVLLANRSPCLSMFSLFTYNLHICHDFHHINYKFALQQKKARRKAIGGWVAERDGRAGIC